MGSIIIKWILIYYMGANNQGGPDHIEFKTKLACEQFKVDLEKSKVFDRYIYCKCIPVKEENQK